MKAFNYTVKTASGRHIRQATAVRFADGVTIHFIDKIPHNRAIEQAKHLRRNTAHEWARRA